MAVCFDWRHDFTNTMENMCYPILGGYSEFLLVQGSEITIVSYDNEPQEVDTSFCSRYEFSYLPLHSFNFVHPQLSM